MGPDPRLARPVGREAVVHRNPGILRPDLAAAAQPVVGKVGVAEHVQPGGAVRQAQAGLVHAGHREGQGAASQTGQARPVVPCHPAAQVLDRAGGQRHPVQFPQQTREAGHRQVLGVAQVGHQGGQMQSPWDLYCGPIIATVPL